jgi:peroxiredoxin
MDDARRGTGPDLEGKVILLDFWGTWCPGCVQAMPQIQKLHDRYRARGLVVIAVSYEDASTLSAFLKKNAYTMPVVSDTDLKCTMAYGIDSWPTCVLIDRNGKVAYVGHSLGIEPIIQEILRVRFDPTVLLTRYLDALNSKNERAIHDVLFTLAQRSLPDFNLREWAVFAGGVAQAEPDKTVEGEEALREIFEARKRQDTEKESSLLDGLATGGPESFDLRKWSRTAFGRAFPIRSEDVRALLTDERYREIVEALRDRFPDSEALGVAAGDAGLQEYCKAESPQRRNRARKALIVQNWVFKGRLALDEKALWRELDVQSISHAIGTDGSRIENATGIQLGGTWVMKGKARDFIQRQLELHVLMDSLTTGQPPITETVADEAERLRKAILADLEAKYGGE